MVALLRTRASRHELGAAQAQKLLKCLAYRMTVYHAVFGNANMLRDRAGGRPLVRRVTWKTATDEAGFSNRARPCASVPLRVYKRSSNTFADCSDTTNVSFIVARVAPTKS